ncbi:Uncharacterised protein [Helicobacter muridarum]|uniref:Uncharacterized protein n=1 Tax=Helicobacter muridarum TaxID=216 RepID=A0A377PUD8_9HELI|nr:Uncharacterised protein [Helicobacter muridarum]
MEILASIGGLCSAVVLLVLVLPVHKLEKRTRDLESKKD